MLLHQANNGVGEDKMKRILMDESADLGIEDHDVYSEGGREKLLEDDEIDAADEGFVRGWEDAE